jgi:oligopeptide transport system substrate-binding protein
MTRLKIAALLAAALLLPACSRRETPAQRGIRNMELRIGAGAAIADLDPQLATGVTDFNILLALFDGLTDLDPATLAPRPALAQGWEISPDKFTWTFHLCRDARWSDGRPLTAADCLASWRRLLSPGLASDYASLLYCISGAEDFHRGRRTDFTTVGVWAPDDHTLAIRLNHPTPHLATLLALPPLSPVPLHAIEKSGPVDRRGNPWTRPANFVGSGPFRLVRWRPGQEIVVERDPAHRDAAAVSLRRVVFVMAENLETEERMYRAGQLHVVSALSTARVAGWRSSGSAALRTSPFFGTDFLRVNTLHPPLDDSRIRRALAISVDRQRLADRVLLGTKSAAPRLVPPGFPGYPVAAGDAFDLAEARRLLVEAGHPDGNGIRPLRLLYNSSDQHRLVCEALQQMWRDELGLRVELASQEDMTFRQSRRQGEFDLIRSSWTADYIDPSTFLDLFASTASNNHTGWQNPGYDSILLSAHSAPLAEERADLLFQAEDLLLREAPIIPLYHYTNFYLVDTAVEGWTCNPIDRRPLKQLRLVSRHAAAP